MTNQTHRDINDITTGEIIRPATADESERYEAMDAAGDTDPTNGAVAGEDIAEDLRGLSVWLD